MHNRYKMEPLTFFLKTFNHSETDNTFNRVRAAQRISCCQVVVYHGCTQMFHFETLARVPFHTVYQSCHISAKIFRVLVRQINYHMQP